MVEVPRFLEQSRGLRGAVLPKKSLMEIWAEHYLQNQDFFNLPIDRSTSISTSEVITAAAQSNRSKTVEKIQKYLQFDCELGALRTNTILSIANVINLGEARFLAQSIEKLYSNILEHYQFIHLPIPAWAADDSSDAFLAVQLWTDADITAVSRLAKSLNPVLVELQEQHLIAQDSPMIGFVTTQLHFTSQEIYKRLTPAEQYLISPYFQFAEEQVCIPWERICKIAQTCPEDSPRLAIVKRFLGNSRKTSERVYQKVLQLYPDFQSHRGALSSPTIRASSLRDISMLQGYLALCFLEEDMSIVERKLLPLCLIVFPKLSVKWSFVRHGLAVLMAAIYVQLSPQERRLLHPYAKTMLQLFSI